MPSLGFPFFSPTPSRERVAGLFRTQRATDPFGIRIHEVFALGAVFFAGWPTTYVEWAYAPVGVCMLVRAIGHIHVPGPLLWDRSVQLLLVWVAVLLGSWFWTAGSPPDWVGDIQVLRFIVLLPALYMVMERRRAMVIALSLGIACGQLSQVAQIAARVFDLPWLIHQRNPGRDSGWWDPVVGGSILCAGLGLHLPALLFQRSGRVLLLGAAGFITAFLCIIATGTRGAIIGAGLTVFFGVALMLARGILTSFRSRTGMVVRIGVLLICLGGTFVALYVPGIRQRIDSGRAEVQRAVESGNYSSDTGMRIAAWKWAWLEFTSHPVAGVGAGAFKPWAIAHAPKRPDLPAKALPHAHSTYFHALATTGLVGALGLVGAFVLAVCSGLRDPDSRAPLGGYDAGPAFALVGLMSAGLFDSIQVNAQTASLVFILIAMCVACRPQLVLPGGSASNRP